jgi:hypothetical protein
MKNQPNRHFKQDKKFIREDVKRILSLLKLRIKE